MSIKYEINIEIGALLSKKETLIVKEMTFTNLMILK